MVYQVEQNPTKGKQNNKSEDIQIVWNWTNNSIEFDYNSMLTLQECYNNYWSFVVENYDQLPFKKRQFSKTFKEILSEWVSRKKVRIHNRSKVQFEGLRFTDTAK